jgi:lysophospholipase L1-like esterase
MNKVILGCALFCLATTVRSGRGELVIGAEKLFRNQLKVTVGGGADTLCVLEQSTNFLNFAPMQLFSGQTLVDPTHQFAVFRAEQLSPLTASYCQRAAIDSPLTALEVNQWCHSLQRADLLEHAVYMASFLPEHVGKFRTSIPAIVGAEALCSKEARFAPEGMVFDGRFYASFKNPLPAQVSAMSVFAVFTSEPDTFGLLVGNDGGDGKAGPAFWVGGDTHMALDAENIEFTVTENGFATSEPGFRIVRTHNWGNQSVPEAAITGVGSEYLNIRVDIDREFREAAVPNRPVANPGTEWRIGARLDGTIAFKGKLHFLAIFDKQLAASDLDLLRASYQQTVGKSVAFPRTQLIIEGDSLSEEAFRTEYGHYLHNAPNWKGKYMKRNIARFGETTEQMLSEFDSEVPKTDPGNNYLFIWGGRNDLGTWTAPAIFERLRTYWRKSREAGYKVAAFTIIPAAYETTTRPDIGEQRKDLNALIRDASSEYDFLFDVDLIPALQDPSNLTYFKPDGVHITGDGSKQIVNLINSALIPEN